MAKDDKTRKLFRALGSAVADQQWNAAKQLKPATGKSRTVIDKTNVKGPKRDPWNN